MMTSGESARFARRRRRTALGVSILILVLVLSALFVRMRGGGEAPGAGQSRSVSSQQSGTGVRAPESGRAAGEGAQSASALREAPAVDPVDVEQGARALEDLPADPAAGIAPEASRYFDVDPAAVLPEGARLDVDRSTWTPIDEDVAMVLVRMSAPGRPPENFTAIMQKSSGRWLLAATLDAALEDAPQSLAAED